MSFTELPTHWKWVKLGDVSSGVEYGSAAKSKATGRIPVLRMGNIQNGKFDWNDLVYTDDAAEIKKYLLKKNDVLFNRTNSPEWVGKTAIFKGERPAIFAGYLIRINRIESLIDADYLAYFLNSLAARNYGSSVKSFGVNQSNINGTKLKNYPIPLPPLAEQQRIVAKLEELFSELDAGLASLKTAAQQLKTYRQAVLKWAFEGKLTNDHVTEGELPLGWEWVKLGDFLQMIEAGKSFKCDERPPKDDEIGIVKVSAVTWGEFAENESKTILSNDQFRTEFLIGKDDFLFSRANTIELVGACVIVKTINKKLMLSDKTLRFIFNENIRKEFALYYLRSRIGRREIESLSTGNQDSMRNIGQERIKQIAIPRCSLEEQHRIVQEIESRLSVCDKLEETLAAALRQAEALRQSILKQAFAGKLISSEYQL